MAKSPSLYQWLETHWVTPAYAGGILMSISLCFFGAAANTMAGWLYVLSGMMIALSILGAVLPWRSLKFLQISHRCPNPVSAGQDLTIEWEIKNNGKIPVSLVELIDRIPSSLSPEPRIIPLEKIAPGTTFHLTDYLPTEQRGVYRWQTIDIKSGSPFGLFWCRRSRKSPLKAVVYPQILPLNACPIIDSLGQQDNLRVQSNHHYHAANEGLTKTLRPYRYGDAMRLIHWRSSARFEEFKVRELEVVTGTEEVIIGLDSHSGWNSAVFEQAIIAAASLYFYASRSQLNARLWTAGTGLIQGNRAVLETLAAIMPEERDSRSLFPKTPMIWLTQTPATLDSLPLGSRWLLFTDAESDLPMIPTVNFKGLVVNHEDPLNLQLQQVMTLSTSSS
ncbi:MAG: DUF58 domain-containing protein [Microcystaceae cyanobacterium]